jgi:hypothetical protein
MGCMASESASVRGDVAVTLRIDLTQVDTDAGKHWLSKLTPEELAIRRDQIRRKHREKYLRALQAKRNTERN